MALWWTGWGRETRRKDWRTKNLRKQMTRLIKITWCWELCLLISVLCLVIFVIFTCVSFFCYLAHCSLSSYFSSALVCFTPVPCSINHLSLINKQPFDFSFPLVGCYRFLPVTTNVLQFASYSLLFWYVLFFVCPCLRFGFFKLQPVRICVIWLFIR